MVKRVLMPVLICIFLIVFYSFLPAPVVTTVHKPLLKTIIIDAGHGLPDPGAQGEYSNEADITLALALNLENRLKEVLPDTKLILTRRTRELPNGLTNANLANRYRAEMANENFGDLFIAIHVNSDAVRYQKKIEGYRTQRYTTYVGKGSKRRKITKTRRVPIYKSYKLPCGRKGTETYIWAVNKYDQKQESVGSRDDDFADHDTSAYWYDSPEAKILASLRTKKYFDQSLAIATFVEEEFKKEGRNSYGVKQRNHKGIWVLQATNMPSILVETGFICTPSEEEYLNSEQGQNEVTYAIMRGILRYKDMLETGTTEKVAEN